MNKQIMMNKEVVLKNEKLEAHLEDTGEVPEKLLKEFVSAYLNDHAVSIGWLVKKLKILKRRIIINQSVYVYENNEILEIKSIAQFDQWISKLFPLLVGDL